MGVDPGTPLPGPPQPWAPSRMPAWRDGPPYAMTEMIAAEPPLAERLVSRLRADPGLAALAGAVRALATEGRSIVATGCGTSEHAAMALATFLADALRGAEMPWERVASAEAFELAGSMPRGGLLLAVSHEGGTAATNLALTRARDGGMATAVITVGSGSPAAALADHLILTGEQDQSWCHTVGYLSPVLAGALLAAAVAERPADPTSVRALLEAADQPAAAEAMASAVARCTRVLVAGSGADYVTARELALKLEEGGRLPAVAHRLETVLHGHLATAGPSTALVVVLTDADSRGAELVRRAGSVLRAAAALGMPAAAVHAADLGDDLPLDLTPAGRAVVPLTRHLPRAVAAILGAAIPIQLLAERLSRVRGINPDTLGREDPRHAAAAEA